MTTDQKEQIISTIKTEIEDLLNKIDIATKVECKSEEDNRYLAKIHPEKEEDSGVIIGARGETMLALQHLMRIIVNKKIGEPVFFVIDVGNYREKQEEILKNIAEDAASSVASTNKPVILKPMSSFERRVVHLVIKNKDGVKSESVGENDARRVMVRPEGNE